MNISNVNLNFCTDYDLRNWLINGFNADTIKSVERIAQQITEHGKDDKLTSNQFRNIFGEVKTIQIMKSDTTEVYKKKKTKIVLLNPKIKYSSSKKPSNFPPPFADLLCKALDIILYEIEKSQNDSKLLDTLFNQFVNFLEAILAYHKSLDKSFDKN